MPSYPPSNICLTGIAKVILLVIVKMCLTIVIAAVVAVPPRQGVANDTFAYRLVIVVVFPWFCRRWFLLSWLCLHRICLRGLKGYDAFG